MPLATTLRLLAKARGNSGMDGRTGSWPQTTLTP